MSSENHINRICPHLGLVDDADTSLAFPSTWNHCYRSLPVVAPKLKHQRELCLTDHYQTCPLLARQEMISMPEHLQAPNARTSTHQIIWGSRWWIVISIIFFIGFALFWRISHKMPLFSLAGNQPTRSAVFFASSTSEISPSSIPVHIEPSQVVSSSTSVFPSLTPSPLGALEFSTVAPFTVLPSSTISVTVTLVGTSSGRALDSVIGTDYKFVIHKIQGGENLDQFAFKYNTSTEAILMVSFNLKPPVWVGAVVVIPVGFTDVVTLPAFEAYQWTDADQSLDSIAQKFGVAAKDIIYYNAIIDNEHPISGDWLLIPHPRP